MWIDCTCHTYDEIPPSRSYQDADTKTHWDIDNQAASMNV